MMYINDNNDIAVIYQSADNKWFSYVESKNEYSPAFEKQKNLIKWLEREGYREE